MISDFDLLLDDRIRVIQNVNDKYNLEENAYLSFSGGKDSTILHYLLDIALPNNNIPRLYLDTGIEYNLVREFVLDLSKKDKRIIVLKSCVNITKMLSENGYPFKSKFHSQMVYDFNNGLHLESVHNYIDNHYKLKCPTFLKYQFSGLIKYNYSDSCCRILKKEPSIQWMKNNNRSITITGMRRDEGGLRSMIKGCILTDSKGALVKFHPLLVVDKNFVDSFIKRFDIQLCKLYYPPYNFLRTGCKGCPFNPLLQEDLNTMKLYLPNEYNQCNIIWKPVYDEYRRINYRLII